MSERLMPSDEEYSEINRLQEMLIVLVNRRISGQTGKFFLVGQLVDIDTGEAELKAMEAVVRQAQAGQLDKALTRKLLAGSWGEFIPGMSRLK